MAHLQMHFLLYANSNSQFLSLLVVSAYVVNLSHVAQSCYSVIGDKPLLWSKPKFDPP